MTDEDYKHGGYPIYHGRRSKKTADQIKREGFCAYGSPVDEKLSIIEALRFFGKENILTHKGPRGDMARDSIREIMDDRRRNLWASTYKETAKSYAPTSPEHISLTLSNAGVPKEDILRYLREKRGSNCHIIKLKQTALRNELNFNTGQNCIPPHFIDSVETYTCNHKRRNKKRYL